jgi:hypothetical protein
MQVYYLQNGERAIICGDIHLTTYYTPYHLVVDSPYGK